MTTQFPNLAGYNTKADTLCEAELKYAGIDVHNFEIFREGEVKTSILGTLSGWSFKRAWRYWVAKGHGIPVEAAEKLHKAFGNDVRVSGSCVCPSPRKAYHGLGVDLYHVDTFEGLKALADTIKEVVAANDKYLKEHKDITIG